MNPSLLLRLAAPALLVAGLAAPALAQQAPAAAPTATDSAKPDAQKGPRDWPNCVRDTGTLIANKTGRCLNVPGRSYDQDDIRNTGATTIGGALDKLDPSVSVRGR